MDVVTREGLREEVDRLDVAVFSAVAATQTPRLDGGLRHVSSWAADHWKPWIGTAAVLVLTGGTRGRRAAVNGLGSTALSSAVVVNLVLKPLAGRHRPDRPRYQVPISRQVAMPQSRSFPSGHAAAGAAFAAGVGGTMPQAGLPLAVAATLVAVLAGPHGRAPSR